jgi:hypothetical protein
MWNYTRNELRRCKTTLVSSVFSRSEPPETDEEMIFMRTARDMNLSKLVADDVPLFLALLKVKITLETSGEDVKTTLEMSGEDVKTTLETSGEDVKTKLEMSGEDKYTRNEWRR